MGTKQTNTFNPQGHPPLTGSQRRLPACPCTNPAACPCADNDMALYSLFKLTVLCALFHEAAAADTTTTCTGALDLSTYSNAPDGMYTAHKIPLGGGTVHFVDLMFKKGDINALGEVTYSQNLQGCLFNHGTSPPVCEGSHVIQHQVVPQGEPLQGVFQHHPRLAHRAQVPSLGGP